jgi:solute carrier family 13 (sodium-dependent dicarboxylate transporter), member 2/3/5
LRTAGRPASDAQEFKQAESIRHMCGRFLSLAGGVLIAIVAFIATQHAGLTTSQSWTAAVATLCGVWWVLEALPLSATALVPVVIFPLAGVLTVDKAASAYGDPYILLFMGGFMLSRAAEYWGAHRRIAQVAFTFIGGTSGRRVVLAVIIATTFLSAWINNTATAIMMLPIALALIDRDKSGKLAVPLLLSVAYGASIGGIATPIGTAPNGVFMREYKAATGLTVPFHQWMMLCVPITVAMMFAAWFLLTYKLKGVGVLEIPAKEPWTKPQKRTLAVFALACIGWITREIPPYGGWATWLGVPGAHDMTVAIAATLLLFLIPSGNGEKGSRLLTWKIAEDIPWGVLVLFGGGICLATGFESSGLSQVLGDLASGLRDWPPVAIIATLCFSVTFLSEFTSNTATANILMPILAATAKANGMNPALLMIPATLSNSLAFMMPVGTPPNAIAYGTGHVKIGHMIRAGFVLNIIGAMIVTLFCWLLLPLVFDKTG